MTVKLAPSILDADFGYLADQVQAAAAGGADWIHVDVMDGQFVPNLTLGPAVVRAIRRATTLPLDVHLMVLEPHHWIAPFRDAGADLLTFHLEADRHPHRTLMAIKDAGVGAGLALNPGTPVLQAVALVELLDLLLIMSVNPGFGGQAFIPSALGKIRDVRAMTAGREIDIEVDGGINAKTARISVENGANVLVAGTSIFHSDDYARAIHELRGE